MTSAEILQKLVASMRASTRENVDWNAVTPQATIESLGFDSLTILDLLYEIQQAFGIEFEAEEIVNVKTVADLIAFLKTKGV